MIEDVLLKKLKKINFFTTFTEEDYHNIQPYLTLRTYPRNSYLIKQGAINTDFNLIIKGRASVEICMFGGKKKSILATLKTPENFGDAGLLAQRQATANIKALTEVQCITLTNDNVKLFFLHNEGLMLKLKWVIALYCCKKIRATIQNLCDDLKINKKFMIPLKLKNSSKQENPLFYNFSNKDIEKLYINHKKVPFFKNLKPSEFEFLIKHCDIIKVQRGNFALKENYKSSGCLFVLWGATQTVLVRNTTIKIRMHTAGDVIGVTELFCKSERVFSEMAREDSILLHIKYNFLTSLKTSNLHLWYKIYNRIFDELGLILIAVNHLPLYLRSKYIINSDLSVRGE